MPAGSNTLPILAPQTLASVSNRWIVPLDYTYDFSQPLTNIITAVVTAPGDARTNNNALSVYMDALTFQIGVYTGTFWQYTIPGDMSFYEHLNILFSRLNRKLGDAVFPRSPQGILDRYRVDNVYMGTHADITVSFAREPHPYYTAKSYFSVGVGGGGFRNYPYYFIGHTFNWNNVGIFSIMGMDAFIHEAGHMTQLPDIYNFNLPPEYNHITGERILCDWMEPPGKENIMRDPYAGDNSIFTEYESIAANFQPGEQRPVTPEMINAGPGNTNWGYMFRDIQTNVEIRIYYTDGRELLGVPVNVYRSMYTGHASLEFSAPPNVTGTYISGFMFDPDFMQASTMEAKVENCYMVEIQGQDNSYHYVLDLPHFNYLFWLGQEKTACFHFTNAYTTIDISSVSINGGAPVTDDPEVMLNIDVPGTALLMRISNDEAGIDTAPLQTFNSTVLWSLPPDNATHTVYVQVVSADYVPSALVTSAIQLIPEPVAGMLVLVICFAVCNREVRRNP
jgi:hypothetical protein